MLAERLQMRTLLPSFGLDLLAKTCDGALVEHLGSPSRVKNTLTKDYQIS